MIDATLVVPSVARHSLTRLLQSLVDAAPDKRAGCPIVVVDDRAGEAPTPELGALVPAGLDVTIARSHGRGPAAARNVGAMVARDGRASEWIVFVDDDVHVTADWWLRLRTDLDEADCHDSGGLGKRVAAVFGQIEVPLPSERRPSDWERNTARLSTSRWITADAAIRRSAFERVGGFDEGFRRAYREDSDLALRLVDVGCELRTGTRVALHPPRPAPWHASLASQRGNAADARMARKHGCRFRNRLDEPPPLDWLHAGACTSLAVGLVGAGLSRPTLTKGAAAVWVAITAGFAAHRVVAGPVTAREVGAMTATSALIPPAALWHRAVGELTTRRRQ